MTTHPIDSLRRHLLQAGAEKIIAEGEVKRLTDLIASNDLRQDQFRRGLERAIVLMARANSSVLYEIPVGAGAPAVDMVLAK